MLDQDLKLLLTLYLTDTTTVEDILEAKSSGIIYACKLYPAGATTNSEYGVTDIAHIQEVLKTMADVGLLLLIHGEVTSPDIDVFDRERVFIETILKPIVQAHPNLKIVMEHVTTSEAIEFITQSPPNVAATITAHHLLYNRSDIFKGGIRPHMYCLPILKGESHRRDLLKAATSGNPKFFAGSDSAPHPIHAKETTCGCAGIFTGHASLELYAEAFDSVNSLSRLEGFTSVFGALFYGLEVNSRRVKLVKQPWTVPDSYPLGDSVVRPLRAGELIHWKVVTNA